MVERCNEYNAMVDRAAVAVENARNRHINKKGFVNPNGFVSKQKALKSRAASLMKHVKNCPRCNDGVTV